MPCGRRVVVLLGCALAAWVAASCGAGDGSGRTAIQDDDAIAPGSDAPVDLTVVAVSSDTVALSWREGSDPVDGYEIRRDGQLVGTSRGTRFLDAGVTSGEHRYEITGRVRIAIEDIDVSTASSAQDVVVPDAAGLAAQRGGRLLSLDQTVDTVSEVTLDSQGRVAVSGFIGDLFVIERLDSTDIPQARRFLDGFETGELLPGTDVWYVVGDDGEDGERRPVIALDPDTLDTRWSIESTTLELTGGCRFTALLADGALSCRGFADDTLRIGADGGVGPTSAGVRIPTGDRTSADDGRLLIDVWLLPAATVPGAFFPTFEWVSRDVLSGAATDRGRLFDEDPAIDFPFTVDAVGVLDGQLVLAGDVLANGCLRVCVESLEIPPYVDGHYVARLGVDSGRVEAVQRLPFGSPLGVGAGRVEGDMLAFISRDSLKVLDIETLSVTEQLDIGGDPVALAATSVLARVPGDEMNGTRWFEFLR